MPELDINGTKVIIQGQAVCGVCGVYYEGEPMQVHVDINKHAEDTGHDVYFSFREMLDNLISDDWIEEVVSFTEGDNN